MTPPPRQPGADPALARAQTLHRAGRLRDAAALYADLLKRYPDHPALHHALGSCLLGMGASDRAVRPLRAATRLSARNAEAWYDLSQALSHTDAFDDAESALDRALEARPGWAAALAAKADLLRATGRRDEAGEIAGRLLDLENPDALTAIACAGLAPLIGREAEAASMLERALRSDLAPAHRAAALFRLGDLRDKAGAYDDAFEAYRAGNEGAGASFDLDGFERSVDALIRAWSPEQVAGVARARDASELPVFIVGMPRSGTSLVEQILGCHPEVTPGGERRDISVVATELASASGDARAVHITDLTVFRPKSTDRLGSRLLRSMRQEAGKSARFTDKRPDNFRHLGLIQTLLPGSRVVHCLRDPADTCLSCYFQHFNGPHSYAYDLGTLGAVYVLYRRLMDHWCAVLDIPILEVRYEDLVADQEAVSRGMIEFLGLGWDEACLRFHESTRVVRTLSNDQVRRPMYRSSVGRAGHYAKHLAPLHAALAGLSRE